MIIGVGLIIAVVYLLFRKDGYSPMGSASGSAEEILRRRFVEGEIDEKEYREKREALRR